MEELEKLKQENEQLNKHVEKLDMDYRKLFSKNCDIERENKRLLEQILAHKIENIAELKASKILFKMVKGGYTHRQKNTIADHVNIILDTDIKEKIAAIKIPENDTLF